MAEETTTRIEPVRKYVYLFDTSHENYKNVVKKISEELGITVNNVKFTVSDMSGRDGYRSMWESMYSQCDAIVFVVDSTDQMRFAVVKDELDMMLRHPDVADRPDLPILFVANKAAAPDACGASAMATALKLHEHMDQDRPWRLASTDAVAAPNQPADDGLNDAMKWLAELVKLIRQQ